MIINTIYFLELNLEYNDLIDLVIETGERFRGLYHGNYDGKSFLFYNYTYGKEQIVYLNQLQRLERG